MLSASWGDFVFLKEYFYCFVASHSALVVDWIAFNFVQYDFSFHLGEVHVRRTNLQFSPILFPK
jgi:hypothetical protein